MSFTLFKKLPPELRVMIWKATLPGPIIFGDCLAIEQAQNMKSLQQYNALPEANGDPVALFVNFESRETALRHFTRNTCMELDSPVLSSYIDYNNDVAVFDYTTTPPSGYLGKDPVVWEKLTKLIIMECPDESDIGYRGLARLELFFEWLLRLPRLEEAVLVIDWKCLCGEFKDEHETVISQAGRIVRVYGGCRRSGEAPDLMRLYVGMLKREFKEMAEEFAAARSNTSATW
jgi:hypothetical protein